MKTGLKGIVNPDTNEYYPALNKAGNPIKGTGAKHIVKQIIRFKRKDGRNFFIHWEVNGYDAFGNSVQCTLLNPKHGKGRYSPMNECTTSVPTPLKYRTTGT